MKKALKPGQLAPAFSVKDVHGKSVGLPFKGADTLLLVFSRYASCPWCNLVIHRLSLEYPLLQKNNCEVIAFIQSTPENIRTNIFERHKIPPPFPVVADQACETYNRYGVTTSLKATAASITKIPQWVHAVKNLGFKQGQIDGNLFLVPAWFLIDAKSRKIIKCSYGTSFYDHKMFVNIYESLFFPE